MNKPPVVNTWLYRRALYGYEPAEGLGGTDRDRLFRVLHRRRWTDREIAVHTLWTTYTVARIRERLRLAPNIRKGAAA